MWPALRDGDRAELVAASAFAPGDVLVARVGTALVAHRVKQIDGATLLLQGDACGAPDPAVPGSAILGRIERVARGGAVLERPRWDHPRPLWGRAHRLLMRLGARARGLG